MAAKKYAYYNKGNKIAIIEQDRTNLTSNEYGKYKSPLSDVTDGIEIEYTYAPFYDRKMINPIVLASTAGGVTADDFYFKGFTYIGADKRTSYPTDDYISVKNNPVFNGSYKIISSAYDDSGSPTTTDIILNKNLSEDYATADGGFGYSTWNNEENLGTITRAIEHINKDQENFEIPITRWQANAIVYYLKAKIAEDMKDMEGREYYMRLFRIHLEKSASAKKHGTHIAQGHWNMLK
jgi:hypothetical protein